MKLNFYCQCNAFHIILFVITVYQIFETVEVGFNVVEAFSHYSINLRHHSQHECTEAKEILSTALYGTTNVCTVFNKGVVKKKTTRRSAVNLEIYDSQGNDENLDEQENDFFIRNAKYGDLVSVADILVEAFHKTTPLLTHYHQLKELDRLQTNFPYSDPNHCMYVAISRDDQQIVGFVDVDFRKTPQRNAPPRPYLSDLAVDEKFRRKGIARRLILTCERKSIELKKERLYLRVESKNENAIKMYSSLGYSFEPSNVFGVLDTTMLLKRDLLTPRPRLGDSEERTENAIPIDFVV